MHVQLPLYYDSSNPQFVFLPVYLHYYELLCAESTRCSGHSGTNLQEREDTSYNQQCIRLAVQENLQAYQPRGYYRFYNFELSMLLINHCVFIIKHFIPLYAGRVDYVVSSTDKNFMVRASKYLDKI